MTDRDASHRMKRCKFGASHEARRAPSTCCAKEVAVTVASKYRVLSAGDGEPCPRRPRGHGARGRWLTAS
jgi:hypothetical protein